MYFIESYVVDFDIDEWSNLTEMVQVIGEWHGGHGVTHATSITHVTRNIVFLHCYGKIDVIPHQTPHNLVMMQYNMRELFHNTGAMLYHHEEHTPQVSKDDWLFR